MFGFSAGVGEVALVALPALLALPAVIAVGTAAGFVVPGFPAIAPLPAQRNSSEREETLSFRAGSMDRDCAGFPHIVESTGVALLRRM